MAKGRGLTIGSFIINIPLHFLLCAVAGIPGWANKII